jgi:hypothetical protein
VLLVGEDISLLGQVSSTAINEVDSRQSVLLGNLLGTKVLLDSNWVVSSSLDCGVVGNDNALSSVYIITAN